MLHPDSQILSAPGNIYNSQFRSDPTFRNSRDEDLRIWRLSGALVGSVVGLTGAHPVQSRMKEVTERSVVRSFEDIFVVDLPVNVENNLATSQSVDHLLGYGRSRLSSQEDFHTWLNDRTPSVMGQCIEARWILGDEFSPNRKRPSHDVGLNLQGGCPPAVNDEHLEIDGRSWGDRKKSRDLGPCGTEPCSFGFCQRVCTALGGIGAFFGEIGSLAHFYELKNIDKQNSKINGPYHQSGNDNGIVPLAGLLDFNNSRLPRRRLRNHPFFFLLCGLAALGLQGCGWSLLLAEHGFFRNFVGYLLVCFAGAAFWIWSWFLWNSP
jgi:hypothetical protein